MQYVVIPDDDEIIVSRSLFSDLVFRSYFCAVYEIEHASSRRIALMCLEKYRKIELEIKGVYFCDDLTDYYVDVSRLQEIVDRKFPLEDETSQSNEVINDGGERND